MRAAAWIVRVCLWFCMGTAIAVAAPRPLAEGTVDTGVPSFSVYTSRDGLGDEIWATIGFDRYGFVWGGSASAVARFDGYRWSAPAQPAASSLVRDMVSGDDGTLWAIYEREGLARYDGQQWSLIGESRFFQRFSITGSGATRAIWAMHDRGLSRLVGDRWDEDPGNAGGQLVRPFATAITQSLFGGPRQWVGTAGEGLWFRELEPITGAWQRYDEPAIDDALATELLRSIGPDGSEELWISTYGSGLLRLRDEGLRTWRGERGELPTEALYFMVETRTSAGERLLWIASRAGLLRLRDDRIDVFDRRHGLPSDAVRGLKVQHGADGTDLLWLATEGGMVRAALADSPWRTVSLLGARENGIFGVMVEPIGDGNTQRLWIGSAKESLRMLEGGRWRSYTQADGSLPVGSLRGIWRLPGPDGRTHRLLGMTGAGVLEIDDSLAVVQRPTPWQVQPEEGAQFALARHDGGVLEWWVATARSGVHRWRDGAWTSYTAEGARQPWTVLRLVEQIDASGRSWLWAASLQGIARFDGTRWELLRDVLGPRADGARAVAVIDERGTPVLWVGTLRNGIVRLDVSDPLQPRLLDNTGIPPPPDPTLYSVLADSTGRIYTCTNNGVQQLTPLARGGYSERVFRRRDGIVHDECNTNSQVIDDDDRYWVGTLGGLSVFDPDVQAMAKPPQPRPLFFTAVRVDGVERMLPDTATLTLPAGTRELRIEYALLSGLRENESRYRTQLLDDETAPGDWTAERSRSFTHLSPGRHALRVEARDYAGVSAPPRTIEFTLAPQWWQRRLLQALFVLLLLLAGAAAVLTWNRGLRARQRQLVGQVAARTAELRAANVRLTELSYLDPLTGVANRRRLMEAIGTAIDRARAQARPIGLIVIDVDHFKAYNDRHGHLAGDIALRAVADALATAAREQDLVARFGGEEFACLMLDADRAAVVRTAERMRALVELLPPRTLGNDEYGVTMSAGVVHCVPPPGADAEDLLREADVALYAAKNAGRNRVMIVE